MIEVSNLSRKFGRKTVLNSLSFKVSRGERIGIDGANGSGKTTLLRIISTLLLPTSGKVFANGHCVRKNPQKIRINLGYVSPSDSFLFPRLTGLQNLIALAQFYGITKKDCEIKINELKEYFPLTKPLNTPLSHCSSGMKQVLKIVSALLHEPEILLFDEPLRSLDKTARSGVIGYLDICCQNKAVLMTSHNPEELTKMSTRILALNEGTLS